ncbi:MAG: SEC-C domain-containing protein [Candidatus Paceibacterota bacterium]|jgi:hypothetical protein
MKLGRNQLCHCGSGKKYKKCHMDEDNSPVPMEVLLHFKKIREKENLLKQKGIYINYVNPVIHKGKKVWAIGNQVYLSENSDETFHDFIQFILKDTLSFEWINEQQSLLWEDQHFIVKCFLKFDEWKKELLAKPNYKTPGVLEAPPNGWTKSLISLAFDISTLRHVSRIPDFLLGRLKTPLEYQGARYEIMIAAIIARLGFNIRWLDEEDHSEPHCEFIATHQESGVEIAVEAKSRHRPGILHTPGDVNGSKINGGGIQRLLNQAFKKTECGKMPFLVFVDINVPHEESGDFKKIPWVKNIFKNASHSKNVTKENPSAWNALYFTNFSFHYQADEKASSGQNLQALPPFVMHPVSDSTLFPAILRALQYYGDIPDIDIAD